jgi:outer membrane protein assembly factor BamB
LVNSLKAVVKPTFAYVRGAPSNLITPVGTIVGGTAINLQRRDTTGEWVYFCCAGNELRWLRQAYAPPAANPTFTTLPPSATPDDVRWLATEPWPVYVAQPPTATPIPPDDFPLYRRDRANTARVPAAFSSSLVQFWPVPALASQPFTSAVVVVRQHVVVASGDNFLYSFDRTFSNQIWRYPVGQRVTQPPMVQENILYLADDSGRALALPDTGDVPLWQTTLSVPGGLGQAPPVTGFVGAGSRLFIAVNNGNNNYRVLQLDRGTGAVLRQFDVGNVPPQALAIGNQLLYIAGAQLWALDLENFEVVWMRDLSGFTTAPVYAANGATALAELYVAGQGGRLYLLDANLGSDGRHYDGGNEVVNGLALGDSSIYAYGNGFVKAYDRRSTTLIWRANIAGDVRSVLVSADQLIIVTGTGSIQFIQPAGASLTIGPSLPTSISHAVAVSGRYLFIPGDDGRLYSFVQ